VIATAVLPAIAQRIAILDFTSASPKDRKRQPKPFPPEIPVAGSCSGVDGTPPLRVSLSSLDKTEYALGDELIYALRLTNTSKLPIRVPTRLSLADMEPEDPAVSYSYEPIEIWLRLQDHEEHGISVLLVTLYGSTERPQTEMELQSGEWFEVRGKAKLEATDRTARRIFADVLVRSDMPPRSGKISDVKALVFSWRGNLLVFDARTQLEYAGCHDFEMSQSLYEGKLDLLPAADKRVR